LRVIFEPAFSLIVLPLADCSGSECGTGIIARCGALAPEYLVRTFIDLPYSGYITENCGVKGFLR